MTDQQTQTVGQQAVALHPQVVVTAQPEQTGQREHVAVVKRSSPASRQPMMHIDTRAVAENATAVAFLDPLAGVNNRRIHRELAVRDRSERCQPAQRSRPRGQRGASDEHLRAPHGQHDGSRSPPWLYR